MPISHLKVSGIRNLQTQSINFSPEINLIFGVNGSGKTSLFESIYFLSSGKSFRTHKISNLINADLREFTLFGLVNSLDGQKHSLGILKSRHSKTKVRIDRHNVTSSSQLARQFPCVVIDSNTFLLLDGSPIVRRQFLDWGVFHVEHAFSKVWSEYNHCLKQRNNLLRQNKVNLAEIKTWDRQLSLRGALIDEMRQRYFNRFIPYFIDIISSLSFSQGLTIKYQRGWNADIDLNESLIQHFKQDEKAKFTSYGPHKADLKITVNKFSAAEKLSRGQKKIMAYSMILAELDCFEKVTGKVASIFMDDISAELDSENLRTLLNKVYNRGSQLFISSIEPINSKVVFPEEQRQIKMFHVEHGKITEVTHTL